MRPEEYATPPEADRVAPPPVAPARRRRRWLAAWAAIAALAAGGALVAATDLTLTGHWHGLFLLRGKEGPRLEVKDDLLLGDGSRLVAGLAFSSLRRLQRAASLRPAGPALSLDWDEAEGRGTVTNLLEDGRQVLTQFSRYEESEGGVPQGLFVGGALPESAADVKLQNESGMAILDARGWRHVWCNVNEGLWSPTIGMTYPSAWKFLGSRVLIRDADRVVIESSHEVQVGSETLRMDRFAYFRAGRPWFKLGIRLVNAGDAPVRFSYGYGDEPWVGNFGDGKANVGWVSEGIVRREGPIDPRAHRWAGIIDEATGLANFVSWIGEELPDRVYFANFPGSAGMQPGRPLSSNEVFIGLEWHDRVLEPGAGMSILLSLGIAETDGTGRPRMPEHAAH